MHNTSLTNLGLLLSAQHDRCLQMNVDDHMHLVIARLEEEMFDVAEQKVCVMVMGLTKQLVGS
jgi:hypothetical protein